MGYIAIRDAAEEEEEAAAQLITAEPEFLISEVWHGRSRKHCPLYVVLVAGASKPSKAPLCGVQKLLVLCGFGTIFCCPVMSWLMF